MAENVTMKTAHMGVELHAPCSMYIWDQAFLHLQDLRT